MTDEVNNVIVQLEEFTSELITKIVLDVHANLLETTPVDTGWARANWVPAIDEPFAENSEAIDPEPSDVQSQAATQQAGVNLIFSYQLENGEVFITNNVPYIQRLNDGSSDQEPEGFVQRAITKAITSDLRNEVA